MSPLILGIESSCDETAAAVVAAGRHVHSNVIASQHDLHEKFGGVVPEIASRAHIERILPVIDEALRLASISLHDLDAIAVGNRPGLIGSLLVGVSAAKALSWSTGKPLIAVNHVEAHLAAAGLDADPVAYPALGLVVSGGHTNLYRVTAPAQLIPLGRTRDDALGEAYDKVASILGLPFPGGPALDKLAQQGNPKAHPLPRTMLEPASLDFSFSGLKTAVLYTVRGNPIGRGPDAHFERDASSLTQEQRADIAASFQAAAVDVIIKKLTRALERSLPTPLPLREGIKGRVNDQEKEEKGDATFYRSLILGGGVSANSLLRQRALEFGTKHHLQVRLPAMPYCLDNAAMIAALAADHLQQGQLADLHLEAASSS